MHITLKALNGRTYIVRISDVRRVVSTAREKECIIYFNNKVDTPITVGCHVEYFHHKYLGNTFILVTDRNNKTYAVRHKSIRRVYTDVQGKTVVCFATKKDTPLMVDNAVADFGIIYLGAD